MSIDTGVPRSRSTARQLNEFRPEHLSPTGWQTDRVPWHATRPRRRSTGSARLQREPARGRPRPTNVNPVFRVLICVGLLGVVACGKSQGREARAATPTICAPPVHLLMPKFRVALSGSRPYPLVRLHVGEAFTAIANGGGYVVYKQPHAAPDNGSICQITPVGRPGSHVSVVFAGLHPGTTTIFSEPVLPAAGLSGSLQIARVVIVPR
jgi:hypothetical protein